MSSNDHGEVLRRTNSAKMSTRIFQNNIHNLSGISWEQRQQKQPHGKSSIFAALWAIAHAPILVDKVSNVELRDGAPDEFSSMLRRMRNMTYSSMTSGKCHSSLIDSAEAALAKVAEYPTMLPIDAMKGVLGICGDSEEVLLSTMASWRTVKHCTNDKCGYSKTGNCRMLSLHCPKAKSLQDVIDNKAYGGGTCARCPKCDTRCLIQTEKMEIPPMCLVVEWGLLMSPTLSRVDKLLEVPLAGDGSNQACYKLGPCVTHKGKDSSYVCVFRSIDDNITWMAADRGVVKRLSNQDKAMVSPVLALYLLKPESATSRAWASRKLSSSLSQDRSHSTLRKMPREDSSAAGSYSEGVRARDGGSSSLGGNVEGSEGSDLAGVSMTEVIEVNDDEEGQNSILRFKRGRSCVDKDLETGVDSPSHPSRTRQRGMAGEEDGVGQEGNRSQDEVGEWVEDVSMGITVEAGSVPGQVESAEGISKAGELESLEELDLLECKSGSSLFGKGGNVMVPPFRASSRTWGERGTSAGESLWTDQGWEDHVNMGRGSCGGKCDGERSSIRGGKHESSSGGMKLGVDSAEGLDFLELEENIRRRGMFSCLEGGAEEEEKEEVSFYVEDVWNGTKKGKGKTEQNQAPEIKVGTSVRYDTGDDTSIGTTCISAPLCLVDDPSSGEEAVDADPHGINSSVEKEGLEGNDWKTHKSPCVPLSASEEQKLRRSPPAPHPLPLPLSPEVLDVEDDELCLSPSTQHSKETCAARCNATPSPLHIKPRYIGSSEAPGVEITQHSLLDTQEHNCGDRVGGGSIGGSWGIVGKILDRFRWGKGSKDKSRSHMPPARDQGLSARGSGWLHGHGGREDDHWGCKLGIKGGSRGNEVRGTSDGNGATDDNWEPRCGVVPYSQVKESRQTLLHCVRGLGIDSGPLTRARGSGGGGLLAPDVQLHNKTDKFSSGELREEHGDDESEPTIRVIKGIRLCQSHFDRIVESSGWLTSQIIDIRMKQLQEQHPYHIYLDTSFFGFLCPAHDEEGHFVVDYQRVKGWTKPSRLPTGRKTLFELEKVFIPINEGNIHWVLVVVDLVGKREGGEHHPSVSFFDSQGRNGIDYVEAIQEYLLSELSNRGEEEELEALTLVSQPPLNAPKQFNNSDCGVLMLHVIEELSTGSVEEGLHVLEQEEIMSLRLRLLESISGEAEDQPVVT